jgi:hypothetical protein
MAASTRRSLGKFLGALGIAYIYYFCVEFFHFFLDQSLQNILLLLMVRFCILLIHVKPCQKVLKECHFWKVVG